MSKRSISALAEALTDASSGRGKKRQAFRSFKKTTKWPSNGTVGKPKPFPVRMLATLRYVETLTLTQATIATTNWCFCANGIYDPNLSGGGHQPYGHDTYSGIYNQYTVLKSKIKITPTGRTASSGNNAIHFGVGIEDSTVSGAPNDTWAERPTYSVVGSFRGDGSSKSLTKTWDRNKRFPHEDTYRALSAPFGSNPSEIEVFNIVVQNADYTNALSTVYMLVEIEYTVEMYELQDLGSS